MAYGSKPVADLKLGQAMGYRPSAIVKDCAIGKTDILARKWKTASYFAYICHIIDCCMNNEKEYLAFISYNHKDKEWAKWLQEWIESYKVPTYLPQDVQGIPPKPWHVFRDETDLGVGEDLKKEIPEQLTQSSFLIVICSPNAVKSAYVELEISSFVELDVDNKKRIIPFIVKGKPNSGKKNECFPSFLRRREFLNILAANVNEISKEYAAIKVLAKMFGNIKPDRLWQRHLVAEEKEKHRVLEERNKLYRIQSLFLSEKSMSILDRGDSFLARLIALEALPGKIDDPDSRPYVVEAENALRKACQIDKTILFGCSGKVVTAYSSNGCYLASSFGDNTIRVWEIYNGSCRVITEGDRTPLYWGRKITALAWHNNTVVAGYKNDYIKIWDVETETCINCIDCHRTACPSSEIISKEEESTIPGPVAISLINGGDDTKESNSSIDDLLGTISPNMLKSIALDLFGINQCVDDIVSITTNDNYVVSGHKNACIRVWDKNNGKLVSSCVVDGESTMNWNWVNCVEISPNGKFIVSGYSDGLVRIWDIDGHSCVSLRGHTDSVLSTVFSKDGFSVLSSSLDKTIRIWDVRKGNCINVLKGHEAMAHCASFSLDNNFIYSASSDGEVRVWRADNGECVRMMDVLDFFSGDLRIRNDDRHEFNSTVCQRFEERVRDLKFAPNGRNLCFVLEDYVVCVLDTSAFLGAVYALNAVDGDIVSMDLDGKHFLTSRGDVFKHSIDDGKVKKLIHINGSFCSLDEIDVSPGEKYLVIFSSKNKTLKIWDIQSKKCRLNFKENDGVSFLAFCRNDDNRFISISCDGVIRIWDIDKSESLVFHDESVSYAVFNPNKNQFASIDSHNICVWDITQNKSDFVMYSESYISAIDYSPNGKYIVSASDNGVVYLWDLKDKNKCRVFTGHKRKVLDVKFGPDNKNILSASEDLTIRVWDVETGNCIDVIDYYGDLYSVCFDREGKKIISVFSDGSSRIWDFPQLQDLIDQTRERFKKRPLTPEERHQYYLE